MRLGSRKNGTELIYTANVFNRIFHLNRKLIIDVILLYDVRNCMQKGTNVLFRTLHIVKSHFRINATVMA